MLHLIKLLIKEKSKNLTSFDDVIKKSEDRLKKLLKFVYTHTSFYHDLYSKHGFSLKDMEHVKIDDLPFTSKEMLMQNFDAVSSDPLINRKDIDEYVKNTNDYSAWYKNKYKIIKTSGTSGNYGVFLYNRAEWDMLKVILMTNASYVKINPFKKVKLAVLVDTRGLHAAISLMSDVPHFFYEILVIDIYEIQKVVTEKLNNFQPDILSGYAHGIYMCAHEQLASHLKIKPKQVSTSGEKLTNEARNTIAKAFNITPINMYGSSESSCMAASSLKCQNLHIVYDWNIVESIDEAGMKIKDDKIGNAVITNLYNYSFPVIRYKMNDLISMHFDSCPDCGSVYPVIKNIEGRKEDNLNFIKQDGSQETLFHSFINFFDEPNIKSYRIIQKEMNFLEIQLVFLNKTKSNVDIEILDRKFKNLFSIKKLNDIVGYNFTIVDEIQTDEKTGKYAHIVTFENYQKQKIFFH